MSAMQMNTGRNAADSAQTPASAALSGFLRALAQRNASVHTVKAYRTDLAEFVIFIGPEELKAIDHILIRAFLGQLYERGLSKASVARSLSSIRSFFKWMGRERMIESNPALLVTAPKLPKKLPRVPTMEEMNSVLDAKMPEEAAFAERDRLILELLYGCGIRNSELTGINLDDIHLRQGLILVHGKGKKQRMVPFGDSAQIALQDYLPQRARALEQHRRTGEAALLINLRGSRLTTRSVGRIVKPSRSPAVCPAKCIPTPCATPSGRTCWRRARTCAPFRSCSATSASPPPSATPNSPRGRSWMFTTGRIRGRSRSSADLLIFEDIAVNAGNAT